MAISGVVSEINGYFRRKSQISPTPCIFNAPAEGVAIELGTSAGGHQLE